MRTMASNYNKYNKLHCLTNKDKKVILNNKMHATAQVNEYIEQVVACNFMEHKNTGKIYVI